MESRGDGMIGSFGDGGPATKAELDKPYGLAVDQHGNIYVREREGVPPQDRQKGVITTVAGTGESGFYDGPRLATKAQLSSGSDRCFVAGLAVDEEANLYIADGCNHRIRKVDEDGVITTVAGD